MPQTALLCKASSASSFNRAIAACAHTHCLHSTGLCRRLGVAAGFTLPGEYHAPALGKVRLPGSSGEIVDITAAATQREEVEVQHYLEALERQHLAAET